MAIDLKKIRDEILAFPDDLDTAQNYAASEAKRARLGSIGTDIASTLGGYKADKSHWDNVAAQGRQTVADTAQRQGAMRQNYQAAQDMELDDPESETSAMARQYLSKQWPNIDFSKHSFRNMQQISPWVEKELEGQRAAAKAKAAAEAEARKREQELADRTDQRNYERGRDSRQNAAALERARVMAQMRGEGRVEPDAQKLGKDMEPFAQQRHDLGIMARASEQPDIPGVGRFDSLVPSDFDSPEAIQVKQAVLRAIQRIALAQSGTAVSDKEAERIAKSRGILGGTEQQYRIGLQSLLQESQDVARSKEAKYSPEVRQTFKDRGGITSDDLPTLGPRPVEARSDEVEMLGPNGESGFVPITEVPEAEANGWKQVR